MFPTFHRPFPEDGSKPVTFRLDVVAWARLHHLAKSEGVTKRVALENLLYRALQLPNQDAIPDADRDCDVRVQRDGAHLRIDIVLPGTMRKKRRPVPDDPRTQLR